MIEVVSTLGSVFMSLVPESEWNFWQLKKEEIWLFLFQQHPKIASLSRQEPQPAGIAKWPTTLRFGKFLGTTSVVRCTENPRDVLQKIHRP